MHRSTDICRASRYLREHVSAEQLAFIRKWCGTAPSMGVYSCEMQEGQGLRPLVQ